MRVGSGTNAPGEGGFSAEPLPGAPDNGADSPLRRSALRTANSVLVAQRRTEDALLAANLTLEERGRELARSLSLLDATLQSTADGVIAIDIGGDVLAFNQRFTTLWALPAELLAPGIQGRRIHCMAEQTTSPAQFIERLHEVMAHPDEEASDVLELRDGRIVERHAIPQRFGDEVLGMVFNFRDVTERERSARALREANDHLKSSEIQLRLHRDHLSELVAERTAELARAREVAEDSNRSKSEFLANMSHELRTPMHAILSFSRLALERTAKSELTNEKAEHYFQRIRQSGQRLLSLLNDLLDLAKLEAGKMTYSFDEHCLREIIDQVAGELSAVADECGVALVVVGDDGDAAVWCDRDRIAQVVRNLLSNALKFSPAGGCVRILLGDESVGAGDFGKEGVTFTVVDDGIGIPADELESVFDKFVQSSKTTSGAGGTGLGLPICREIVNHHRGRIWAENVPEGGTRFTTLLPGTRPTEA